MCMGYLKRKIKLDWLAKLWRDHQLSIRSQFLWTKSVLLKPSQLSQFPQVRKSPRASRLPHFLHTHPALLVGEKFLRWNNKVLSQVHFCYRSWMMIVVFCPYQPSPLPFSHSSGGATHQLVKEGSIKHGSQVPTLSILHLHLLHPAAPFPSQNRSSSFLSHPPPCQCLVPYFLPACRCTLSCHLKPGWFDGIRRAVATVIWWNGSVACTVIWRNGNVDLEKSCCTVSSTLAARETMPSKMTEALTAVVTLNGNNLGK